MFCFCWQVATKLVGVEALQSLLVAHKGTHCKHNCSKHPTRGAKWELILLRNKVRCQVNDVGDLQNLAPVVQNLRCNKGHCQRNWYRLFCKKPPRGAVLVFYRWLLVANTRGKRFGSRCREIVCTHGRLFGAGVEKWHPVVLFWCFVGKFQGIGKSVRVGCFGKLQSKSHPVVAKTHFLACSCVAKWWQWRNWLPLQKHAHGVGVQSDSDVGCGVSVGGRGSVFSSTVQVLHWLCWAVCSASLASCSAVRCACSTLGV